MASESGDTAGGSLRRGWCPTGLVPMAAADGLLLRVRPEAGRLDAPSLRRLAAICHEHGNGAVILTRRAKLELRGIVDSDATVAALQAAGLVPTDPLAAALPDLVVSPATDLDPAAVACIDAVHGAVEQRLYRWAGLADLPAKVAVVIDGGGRARVADVQGDLRFDAVSEGRYSIAVGGTVSSAQRLGCCAGADVPSVAIALLERFLQLRRGHETCMRRVGHVVAEHGVEPFRTACEPWLAGSGVPHDERPQAPILGHRPGAWYGLAFPFGRLEADTLLHLADAAERFGNGDIRILPTRTVLLSGAGARAGEQLRAAGAIDRADDPRLRAEACSGLGGCARGTTTTREDAHRLIASAPTLLAAGEGCMLHVSGCAKGCAHSGPAPITLTGREGRYDVSLQARPGDAPLWSGLDVAAVESRLAALERLVLRHGNDGGTVEETLAGLDPQTLRKRIEEEVAGA